MLGLNLVAFDPGPHVGMAHGSTEHGVNDTPQELTPAIFEELAEGWVRWADVVICEGFNITGPRATSSNVTIEQIGILRYLCARNGKRFVVQQPADSKGFDPKWEKQKRLGVYLPGADHRRSAMRHLMLFMAKEVPGFKEQLLALAMKEE